MKAAREYDTPEQFAAFEADMRSRFGPTADPPEFCKDLPENSWMDIQNYEITLHKQGEWTFAVDDEKASNKRAVKMPGDHHEWAAMYAFDHSILSLTPAKEEPAQTPQYRLYAAVRCDAKEGTDGTAMTLGVYDYELRKSVVSKTLSVKEISGAEYHWIDLGTLPLRSKHNFWFAPPKRPDEVNAVYIDRIVVVRER